MEYNLHKKPVEIPSGKLTSLWKITISNGNIHYKWHFLFLNSYIKSPEGIELDEKLYD